MSTENPVVITIARQLGSGGSELAQRVSRRLGFTYIDRQIIQQAAAAFGMDESDLAPRCERVQGFWARLLHPFAVGTPADIYTPPPFRVPSDEQIMAAERDIMAKLAGKGDCVVLGHAGFHLLRGSGRLLNVFVHAPAAFRARRVLQYYGARDENAAFEMLEESDVERETYVREATGLVWQDVRNYHLSLDVERVGLDEAEELVASLARRFAEGASHG